MSKNQSCVNTCEHYEERSRHGARAHHREGSDVCKQCAAAAAAAGRISRDTEGRSTGPHGAARLATQPEPSHPF